jgi:hypothetical protein
MAVRDWIDAPPQGRIADDIESADDWNRTVALAIGFDLDRTGSRCLKPNGRVDAGPDYGPNGNG